MTWTRIRRSLVFLGFSYLLLVMVFALLETSIMYPVPSLNSGNWDVSEYALEDVYFDSADGARLHGWFAERPGATRCVLLFHGNGEHLGSMGEEIAWLRDRFDVHVLAFDYRGYGRSQGKPHEAGILADGLAAQAFMTQQTGLPAEQQILWGRSLGGAVAVHVAAERGAATLVLDRTFNSMVDVASSLFRWLPVRTLLRNRYPSAEWIQRYTGPLFQVHGLNDRVVPFECGRQLHEACPSSVKRWIALENLSHNAAWPSKAHVELANFLR